MGCCLAVFLLGGAPRIALTLWWFMDPARIMAVFSGWSTTLGSITAPLWVWPLAGLLLVPWTTIAYVFVAPGGITTIEWVVLGIALLLDLSTHGGSGRAYNQRRSVR
jgi:hypothetical protein